MRLLHSFVYALMITSAVYLVWMATELYHLLQAWLRHYIMAGLMFLILVGFIYFVLWLFEHPMPDSYDN